MIEAGAPSTGGSCNGAFHGVRSMVVCAPHRGYSWAHQRRSRATRKGRNAKAAQPHPDGSLADGEGMLISSGVCVRVHKGGVSAWKL